MSGFPHTLTADQLKQALPETHRNALDQVVLRYKQEIVVFLFMTVFVD